MKNYAKMIEALTIIRPMIESGEQCFICIALDTVASRELIDSETSKDIQHWIVDSMGSSGAVSGWLFRNGNIGDKFADTWQQEMKEYRLAWIDDMIRVLKGE